MMLLIVWIFALNCLSFSRSHQVHVCTPECPPCDAARLSACGPLPTDCEELVSEPGCGCCLTCALSEESKCGVYTPHCGNGLKCLGKNNKISLTDLLSNNGKCVKVKEDQSEHVLRKRSVGEKIKKSRRKSLRRSRRHPHLGFFRPLNYDGPCSRHFERLMTSCRPIPPNSWIPHCDDEGNYDVTQCMTSSGMIQGECWCVDKLGDALEGSPYVRGDPHCSTITS